MVRTVTFAQAFSFKYSRRPGTPAAAMKEQVPEAVKSERLTRLQALLRQQQEGFNSACEGQTMNVLFDNESHVPDHAFGRSPFMQGVRVRGDASLVGQERPVLITRGSPNSLMGELV